MGDRTPKTIIADDSTALSPEELERLGIVIDDERNRSFRREFDRCDDKGRPTSDSELLEMAWVIIACASDWGGGSCAEWRESAEKWRDKYHATLPVGAPEKDKAPE